MENQKRPKNSSKKAVKVFGKNPVNLSEEISSQFLGGIVEKGINDTFITPSSTSAFPLPSPLPFPVARHRSHGPHWTPAAPFVASGGNNDETNEENDPTNYKPLADFAEPIKTKKKKGLDFSNWKDAIRGDIDSIIPEKGNTKSLRDSDKKNLASKISMDIDHTNSSPLELREQSGSTTYNEVDMGFEGFSSAAMESKSENNPSSTLVPSSVGYGQGHTSLESQIDAENRVVLDKMTPEEIAEAQEEIRNRLNPELLNLLKRRGVKKLEKKGSSGLTWNGENGVDHKQPNRIEGEDELSGKKSNLLPATPTMPILLTNPDKSTVQNSLPKDSNRWSTWSERVEAVRNLRFALDGNVIEGSSVGPTYTADNVSERDFLRTEGDPGAAGYTVKETLELARSVVPGQRTLAWHLIASILNRALHSICKSQLDSVTKFNNETDLVDWEAVWAYALGPEPELALSLRLAIDDNHQSVTLACAKVIRCILSCDLNEEFFCSTMKLARMDLHTAPVFRSRPGIQHGFFGGGFWKYSTKPSNIIPNDAEVANDKTEGERTIQDDNVIAGQDVAAGLVRMELLPRLRYLLETEPSAALEECILSILIAVARHSPTCANAVWKFERLVQTIVDKFNKEDAVEFLGPKVKSVTLLRVLAQSSKVTCMDFINKGLFQVMTWQLYRVTPIGEWIKYENEKSKLASELMVEQLRFWKVCVAYGQCISSFTSFFPALCVWLNPPTLDRLTETNVFNEYASVTTEIYLVLETLANSLPDPSSSKIRNQQSLESYNSDSETWCWNDVSPMVDSALQWLELRNDTALHEFFDQLIGVDDESVDHNTSASSMLWILSAVMHFLHTVLIKATDEIQIPELASKLALGIMKNGIFNFSYQTEEGCSADLSGLCSLVDRLCYFRQKSNPEASLSAVWCLNTLVHLVASTDRLIDQTQFGKILRDGILKSSLPQWEKLLGVFTNLITSEWHHMRHIEVFGRGGPAPGVGVGWGASGGGFWSSSVVAFQADARLLTELLGSWLSSCPLDLPVEEDKFAVQIINSALASSLMIGPGDKLILQKIFDLLLNIPVLSYLNQRILRFICCYLGKESLAWENKEDDLMEFSKILSYHFTNRWLDVKKKKNKPEVKDDARNSVCNSLASIPEDVETSDVTRRDSNSLMVGWARQRAPLPSYWILSPIATIRNISSMQDSVEFLQVAKAGLFLLLGIEAVSSTLSNEDNSPVQSIPLIWKLHSLSVPLLVGKGILDDEKTRDMYEALQRLYGQRLDELQLSSTKGGGCLRFQTEIHENYSTFFETLVEQFAAVSYGDVIYGRQIAIYLHRQVETSVRLAAWTALSNAHVLELLPPLDKCISCADGYLEPVEDDVASLEAYVKSWVAGALDRSATRGSMSYMVVLHHLSSFIFDICSGESLLLRNKLVKSLLRDYSRRRQHEAMMLDLIQYNRSATILKSDQTVAASSQEDFIVPRLAVLKEACEGNLQLLAEVDKLKSSIGSKQIGVS